MTTAFVIPIIENTAVARRQRFGYGNFETDDDHPMQAPFTAYKGNEDYVFVCYSHANTDVVYEDLTLLNHRGLRVWYDEGISAGSEWSEELAQSLAGAAMVLFYASGHSVNSRHCRDEINFSHNHDKPILVIDLEEVDYPAGLELSLSSTQAVHKYKLNTDQYVDKLFDALPASAVGAQKQPLKKSDNQPGKRRVLIPSLIAMAIVICGLIVYGSNPDYWTARWLIFATDNLGSSIEQRIGFATTQDDVRIAYARTGSGPPVLIVLGWGSHLEDGMMSPTYDQAGVLALSSEAHEIVRYDGRGFGMSDRTVDGFSLEARLADLEAVVEALNLETFALYAMSAGGPTGIAFANRYPEKVSRLVLASTNADFSHLDDDKRRRFESMFDVFETSWDTRSVRELFIDILGYNTDGVSREFFSTFLERSATGSSIKGFFKAHINLDVAEEAKTITVPTLVIHGREDKVIPLEAGRRLASLIPGATYKVIEGGHLEGTGGNLESRKIILNFIDGVED